MSGSVQGASPSGDRVFAPSASSQQAVSPVPASIPSAMIKQLRSKAKEFEVSAQLKRCEARELEVRASEMYDAFISFDLLADKLEQQLASAMSAEGQDPEGLGAQPASAVTEGQTP